MKGITFKTFRVWSMSDQSWTGGGIHNNERHLEQIDKQISDYANQNNLTIGSVKYSYCNESQQHGSSEFNTERRIYIMAAVNFIPKKDSFFNLFKRTK